MRSVETFLVCAVLVAPVLGGLRTVFEEIFVADEVVVLLARVCPAPGGATLLVDAPPLEEVGLAVVVGVGLVVVVDGG